MNVELKGNQIIFATIVFQRLNRSLMKLFRSVGFQSGNEYKYLEIIIFSNTEALHVWMISIQYSMAGFDLFSVLKCGGL